MATTVKVEIVVENGDLVAHVYPDGSGGSYFRFFHRGNDSWVSHARPFESGTELQDAVREAHARYVLKQVVD